MISCSVTIYPVIKAKPVTYPDLVCQPDAISVDSNNVQTQPIRIRPVNRIGGQMEAMKAYIRVAVKSGDMELGQAESGAPLSEWDYYLPSDKWGEADNILITTYEDPRYVTCLAEKQVSILRQHATPFPVEGDWRPLPFKYKNGEYFVDNERNLVYQWMNPVPGNSEIHPFEDIKNNPNTTSWKQHTEWVLLATQVFLANFAKLGSAVFSGDCTISQHGQSVGTNPETGLPYDYRDFDAAMSKFIPNFMIDWLRGKVVGMDMDIQGGKIGGLTVKGGKLIAEYPTQGIEMDVFGTGSDTLRFGSLASELISIRLNNDRIDRHATAIDMDINGKSDRGIAIIANGIDSFCLDSCGSHRFYQRPNGVWDAPGVLYAGHFNGKGYKLYEWGQGAGEVTCVYEGKGSYRINHQVNRVDYFVTIMPYKYWAYATVQSKDDKTFSFSIVDNGRGGLIDLDFDVMIFGRNIYNDYSPKYEQ